MSVIYVHTSRRKEHFTEIKRRKTSVSHSALEVHLGLRPRAEETRELAKISSLVSHPECHWEESHHTPMDRAAIDPYPPQNEASVESELPQAGVFLCSPTSFIL